LETHGLPYTIYMITNNINRDGYLSTDDLKQLAKSPLCQIGSHTKSHTHLSSLSKEQQRDEIVGSKLDLERELEMEVTHFSFPYGDFDQQAYEIACQTYTTIATSKVGVNVAGSNAKLLRRIEVVASDTTDSVYRMISGYFDYLSLKR
uniref:polysaccharide deacetylase family protein n=1 Tax=Thaumasiovibrio subtropicus TaxID=1891207 RepID=UPI00131D0D71